MVSFTTILQNVGPYVRQSEDVQILYQIERDRHISTDKAVIGV